jgi:hypothetical protein
MTAMLRQILSHFLRAGCYIALAFATMLLATFLYGRAFAAGTVDISPIFDAINQGIVTLIAGIIAAALAWFSFELRKLIGAKLDATFQASLNTALQNGVQAGMNDLKAWEQVHKDVAVQGQVQRWAAQYAVDHAPAAIARFGLSPDALAKKALAYIPAPPSLTAPVVNIAVAPNTSGKGMPLDAAEQANLKAASENG